MTQSIRIPNGILTLVEDEFNCPNCQQHHTEADYINKLNLSRNGLIYIKCKKCDTQIGITADIKGDIKVWLKSEEHHIIDKHYLP